MKVAIVYDWMDKSGGVERLLPHIVDIFSQADIYTSFMKERENMWSGQRQVQTSFMQHFPPWIQSKRILSLPFFPYAFESLKLTGYELVISISSSFAKGVITPPTTKHVCYMLSPTRYLWSHIDDYLKPHYQKIAGPYIAYIRSWDYIAAQRPDTILTLSHTVQKRIHKYYHRASQVVYPPFDLHYWKTLQEEDIQTPREYYLVVSRLEPYKKVDIVIQAFRNMPDKHLIIVGDGSLKTTLQQNIPQNIQFYSNISDSQLLSLYRNARGLIMMQEEDFGYTALEALYGACPVITYTKGGGGEIIDHGVTGYHVQEQTVGAFQYALEKFDDMTYNIRSKLQNNKLRILEHYSLQDFRRAFQSLVQ